MIGHGRKDSLSDFAFLCEDESGLDRRVVAWSTLVDGESLPLAGADQR